MESKNKLTTIYSADELRLILDNKIFICIQKLRKFFPKKEYLKILKNAAYDLINGGLIKEIKVVKEGKKCPWDPKLKFYHVMGIVVGSDDNSRICSTGDGYSSSRCLMVAWMEFFERLSMKIAFKTASEMNNQIPFSLYPFKVIPSYRFNISSSNGCAIHFQIIEAIKNAILELIERDAFLCHWYTKTPAYIVDIDNPNMPRPVKLMNKFLTETGWDLYCYKLNAIVPGTHIAIMFCIHRDVTRKVRSFLGIGCDLNLKSAILKAYVEIAKFFTKMHNVNNLDEILNFLPKAPEKHAAGRLAIYQYSDRIKEFDFFKKSASMTTSEWSQSNLKTKNFLKKAFRSLPMLQLKSLEIPTSLKNIVYSVKAFDPTLQDCDFESSPKFNYERLKNFSGSDKIYNVLHPIP